MINYLFDFATFALTLAAVASVPPALLCAIFVYWNRTPT